MTWWMSAMVMYPWILKKAQEEMDKVVCRSRMPTFEDFENLHYIRAMVKEILRWCADHFIVFFVAIYLTDIFQETSDTAGSPSPRKSG